MKPSLMILALLTAAALVEPQTAPPAANRLCQISATRPAFLASFPAFTLRSDKLFKSCAACSKDSFPLPAESTAACSRTVSVAFSCLSGGYPCLRRIRLTWTRICARALSRTVQSIVTLLFTFLTSSRAISRRVGSPRTFTALSFVSRAS